MHTHHLRWRALRAGVLTALMAGSTAGLAQGAASAVPQRATTLAELFRMVAVQPEVAAAEARARAAQGSRTTARLIGNPMLEYRVENASKGSLAPMLEREAMATATLPLDGLYQWWPRAGRADADVRAAQSDAAAVRQRVLVDAARAYHRLGTAQVGVAVNRDLLAWLDTLLAYNRARVREGAAAESDLIRSEIERGRAGAALALTEAELARARADLAQFVPDAFTRQSALVAVVPDRPMELPAAAGPGAAGPGAPGPVSQLARFGETQSDDQMIADALRANPAVRAARERESSAAAGLNVERLSFVRRADATVGTKYVGGATSFVVGASLPFPLFDQNRGEVARASADRDVMRQELLGAERRVRADVVAARDAAIALSRSATELAAPAAGGTPRFLRQADEVRRIALGAYREGATPLMQLLDAARAWGEAQMAFAQLMAAQRDSVLSLLASLGIDLSSTPLPLDGTSR